MTVLLVGGVAWIGSHDLDPRRPIASPAKLVSIQVVSLDWKWLFIYPELGIASVNQLTIPVDTPVSFELTSSGVMNSFFVPQLGGQIYTMAGMATRLNVQADHTGTYRGLSAQYSGSGFSDMHFSVAAVPTQDFDKWVRPLEATVRRSTRKPMPIWSNPADRSRLSPIVPSPPVFSTASWAPSCIPTIRRATHESSSPRGQNDEPPWQAQLERDPVRPADRHGRVVTGGHRRVLILGWVTVKGYWPYLWREWITSVDHKRIGVMYCLLALIMLLRGFADAIMMRAQQAVAAGGAQGYLPPEHFDQIFSAHGTIMIFFMAMPFVIGLMNFVVPLQLGVRDMAFPT